MVDRVPCRASSRTDHCSEPVVSGQRQPPPPPWGRHSDHLWKVHPEKPSSSNTTTFPRPWAGQGGGAGEVGGGRIRVFRGMVMEEVFSSLLGGRRCPRLQVPAESRAGAQRRHGRAPSRAADGWARGRGRRGYQEQGRRGGARATGRLPQPHMPQHPPPSPGTGGGGGQPPAPAEELFGGANGKARRSRRRARMCWSRPAWYCRVGNNKR